MFREFNMAGTIQAVQINVKKIVSVRDQSTSDTPNRIQVMGLGFNYSIDYPYNKMKLLVKIAQRHK